MISLTFDLLHRRVRFEHWQKEVVWWPSRRHVGRGGDIILLLLFFVNTTVVDNLRRRPNKYKTTARSARRCSTATPHRTPPTTTITTTTPSSFVRCSACARGRCATLAGVLPTVDRTNGDTRAALQRSASRNDDSSRWRSSLDRWPAHKWSSSERARVPLETDR